RILEIWLVGLPIRLPQTKAGTNGKAPASSIGTGTTSISSARCATLMGSTNLFSIHLLTLLPRTGLAKPGRSTYRPPMISPDLFRLRANLCQVIPKTRKKSAKTAVSLKQLHLFQPGDVSYSTELA